MKKTSLLITVVLGLGLTNGLLVGVAGASKPLVVAALQDGDVQDAGGKGYACPPESLECRSDRAVADPWEGIQVAMGIFTRTVARTSAEISTNDRLTGAGNLYERASMDVVTQEEWIIETVDTDDVGLKGTSLALDAMGNAHISYQSGGGLKIRSQEWQLECHHTDRTGRLIQCAGSVGKSSPYYVFQVL